MVFCSFNSFAQSDDPFAGDEILKQMIAKTKTIETAAYDFFKQERIKGKIIEEVLSIKLSIEPFMIYTRMDAPKEGMEVLYNSNWEKKKAVINTNSFPWVNVKFSPMSKTMRKDQHHTILDSGYDKLVSFIDAQFGSFVEKSIPMTQLLGEEQIGGKKCWVLKIEDENFSFVDYQVQEGEDLVSIAKKLSVSDYMIMEANRKVKFYDDVESGQIIKVPTSYSERMMLYIDQELLVPIKMEMYDLDGLYELFEFKNLKLNVAFEEAEFSTAYEAYEF